MTKKRTSKQHHLVFWFCFKILITFCVLFCLVAYIGIHSTVKLQSQFSISRFISRSFSSDNFTGPPKIAFLFLARRNLPLDFFWHSFFKNVDADKFSIYIHSEPGFVFNATTTRSAFLYGKQLINSVQVVWGEPTIVEAEKLLLQAALHDPANQRFVLLSDSCVPLYNFSYIYNYLISSPKSFVDSFVNLKGNRYSPKMSPIIPKNKWRKGSQWFALIRRHVEIVTDDHLVFPVFKEFCKPCPLIGMDNGSPTLQVTDPWQDSEQSIMWTLQHKRICFSDEHYVQTLLALNGLEAEVERRSLTYTSWNHSDLGGYIASWHPVTFDYADVSPRKIHEIKAIDHVYHESEKRNEWCHSNNKRASCFLFARKFTPSAATRLSRQGLVRLRNTASLSKRQPYKVPLQQKRLRKGKQIQILHCEGKC